MNSHRIACLPAYSGSASRMAWMSASVSKSPPAALPRLSTRSPIPRYESLILETRSAEPNSGPGPSACAVLPSHEASCSGRRASTWSSSASQYSLLQIVSYHVCMRPSRSVPNCRKEPQKEASASWKSQKMEARKASGRTKKTRPGPLSFQSSSAHGIISPTRLRSSTPHRKKGSTGRQSVSSSPLMRPYQSVFQPYAK